MQYDAAGNEQAKRPVSLRFVVMCAMILLVAGGIVGLSVALPEKSAIQPASPTGFAGVPPLANTTGIQNPRPYQYDPVTDKHWDPNHGHWHPGQPPANAGAPAPGTTQVIAQGGNFTGGAGKSGTPNITNPTPWQYDPVTNKHWQPDHGHWHDGPAPAPENR